LLLSTDLTINEAQRYQKKVEIFTNENVNLLPYVEWDRFVNWHVLPGKQQMYNKIQNEEKFYFRICLIGRTVQTLQKLFINNHRPAANQWQTLPHYVVHLTLSGIQTHNISGDRSKSNYHTITATTNQTLIYIQPCYLRHQNIKDIIKNFSSLTSSDVL
jgi:hypothetical protein